MAFLQLLRPGQANKLEFAPETVSRAGRSARRCPTPAARSLSFIEVLYDALRGCGAYTCVLGYGRLPRVRTVQIDSLALLALRLRP